MNHLHSEKSPYLLQHAENPVDWFPWGDEAFQKATAEDKPVFLSIGYSTCHWCHVMAHESFEDTEVAELLSKDFVAIKVDREERPDIDAVYMSVCQALTGSGGWPLTVIMTPDQKPFFAGTYFPKHNRYGHPGLCDILDQIAELWRNDRNRLLQVGEQITTALVPDSTSNGKVPDKSLLEKGYQNFCQHFDKKWGGFGSAPKFPAPHNLLFLMRYSNLTKESSALSMVEKTLDAMARGGICDQFGGGFSRYSTDEKWLAPHFEKMLYDNALLLMTYTKAYQLTGKKSYEDTARSTADYILRELTDEAGGFYCGQDADSDGVEGKYYVFTPDEVYEVLGEKNGKEICRIYGITDQGNFEGKNIPNLINQKESPLPANDERLAKLRTYRMNRTTLHKDDKVLLSWNGWTIIALTQASRVLTDEKYQLAAIKAAHFIEENMTDDENRLYLRWRDGHVAHAGQLDDYAVYALALIELYNLTFDVSYLEKAIHRGRQMMEFFEDKENGGYFISPSHGEKLISRPKETYDGAIPSGNSVAAAVLQNLAAQTGQTFWQDAADRQFRFLAGEIEHYPAGHAFALTTLTNVLYPHQELVCSTKAGFPKELNEFLKKHPADDLSILVKTADNGETLARLAPFTKEYSIPETGATWYLCENGTCRAPVPEFSMLGL